MTDDEIRERFNRIDINRSGIISKNEIRKALRGYATDEEVDRHLAMLDLNADGIVSWEEFVRHMRAYETAPEQEEDEAPQGPSPEHRVDEFWQSDPAMAARLLARFRQVDTDGSGYLSEEELTGAMTTDGMHLTEQVISTMFAQMDRSDDGRISYAEYLCGLMDGEAAQPSPPGEDDRLH